MRSGAAKEQGTARPGALPAGAATSAGSLPHLDREEAIAFVLDRTPLLPAAPTLPGIDPLELMIPQSLWGVTGVRVGADGTISVPDPHALDPEAPLADRSLGDRPFASWRRFLEAVSGRTAPIKLQLTGPITVGLALVDAGVADSVAFAVAGAAVATRAQDLLALADALAPGVERVVVFDEPGLVGGMRVDLPLTADQVVDSLSGALASVEHGAVTGVHLCGPTDWRLVLQAGPGLVSTPVGTGVTDAAAALGTFLERDGSVVWGAVPADGPLGEHAGPYWRRLSAEWSELVEGGCDPTLLRDQALVSPVCGLALHNVSQADRVFDLCDQLGERIRGHLPGRCQTVDA